MLVAVKTLRAKIYTENLNINFTNNTFFPTEYCLQTDAQKSLQLQFNMLLLVLDSFCATLYMYV
jgi:hypothetical protein